MIDCGRGTAIRLSQIGLGVGCVDTIIISHYHSDHYAGLFDMAMTGTIPQKFGGRDAPLQVYGPPGIKDIADGAWLATGPDRAIRVADNEIDPEHMRIVPHEYAEGVVYDRRGWSFGRSRSIMGNLSGPPTVSVSNMGYVSSSIVTTRATMKI